MKSKRIFAVLAVIIVVVAVAAVPAIAQNADKAANKAAKQANRAAKQEQKAVAPAEDKQKALPQSGGASAGNIALLGTGALLVGGGVLLHRTAARP